MKTINVDKKLLIEDMDGRGVLSEHEENALTYFLYPTVKISAQCIQNISFEDMFTAGNILNKFRIAVKESLKEVDLENAEHVLLIKILKGFLPKMPLVQPAINAYIKELEKTEENKID